MKGTEKQIAWASEIKTATVEALEAGIEMIKVQMGSHPQASAVICKMEEQLKSLIECDSAADIIDCFGGVKSSDPVEKRCAAFTAACRARKANNDTQRKLLGQ